MRRAFTLQLEARPEGRAFTCPQCDIATMRPDGDAEPICPNCSPFLAVRFDHQRGPRGVIVATCRWIDHRVRLQNIQQAKRWVKQFRPRLPAIVEESLFKHFAEHPDASIDLEPPGASPPQAPAIQSSGGTIAATASADIAVGQVVAQTHLGKEVPIGTALNNAKAGEPLVIQINTFGDSQSKAFFEELAKGKK